jgi:hypothetical protein
MAAAGPAAASPPPTGHWGNAQLVPGLGKLNIGNSSLVSEVSCGAPGDCAAAGAYRDRTNTDQAFLVSERGSRWGQAVPAPKPDPTSTDSFINALSCGPQGGCVAVGSFDMPGSPTRGFITTQSDGHWGEPMVVSGTEILSRVSAVSCVRGNNCVVGGFINDGQENGVALPFVQDEVNGAWRLPQTPSGLDALNAVSGEITSVSCASPGDCAAAGIYHDSAGMPHTFVVDESGGTWGPVQAVPESGLTATSSFPTALSCGAPGDCAVVGSYSDDPGRVREQVFVASEVQGKWGSPQPIPGTAKLNKFMFARVNGLACAATGSCVAVGFVIDSTGNRRAFTADEKNGTWLSARVPAGVRQPAEVNSVSCAFAGNCVASGYSHFGDATQAFTLNEVSGTWGTAQPLPGIAKLNTGMLVQMANVACAAAGSCALGGDFVDKGGHGHGFLDEESTATVTSLKLSMARIRFGHEQNETLSVTVKARTGGTPDGQVRIASKATICVIKLKAGKGSCELGPKKLKPGTYQLTGEYGGSSTYGSSATPAEKLTVIK